MARKLALALLALATVAQADGKLVSTQVPVVEIPDQQAILVWKDGRERLVIDTAHTGEGDLAWIVPLPAPPRIEPASPAVFRTLEAVTMPELRDEPAGAWQPGLWLFLAIAVLCATRSPWGGVVVLALLLLGLVSLMSVMIPKSLSVDSVTVLGRSRAGRYETATIQSVDAGAVLGWLQENGFKVAPEVRAGIEEYVRDGWVFAVARLKSGGSGGRAHPLSFEFDAKEAVYPVRLTGTQGRALSLRLFVLSRRRAKCHALSVESCYETRPAGPPYGQDEVRQIGQPELLRIADGATVLTTLRGDLKPSRMRGDLRIAFEDYEPVLPTVYTEEAARSGALTTAVWLALALLFPCYLAVWAIAEREKGWRHVLRAAVRLSRRGKIMAWCMTIGLGLVAGVADYATADIVEMRSTFGHSISHSGARRLVEAEADADMEKARASAAAFWLGNTNPYDGLEVREEPSPGNYGLELRYGRVVYVRYDSRGAPMGPDDW